MAKSELWQNPLLARVMDAFGTFPVERGIGRFRCARPRRHGCSPRARCSASFRRAPAFPTGVGRTCAGPLGSRSRQACRSSRSAWSAQSAHFGPAASGSACRRSGSSSGSRSRSTPERPTVTKARALTGTLERIISELGSSYGEPRARLDDGMSLHGYAALILIGWGAAAAILFALYLHQRRTGNATLVDAGWASEPRRARRRLRSARPGRGRAPDPDRRHGRPREPPDRLPRPRPGERGPWRGLLAIRSSADAGARKGREQLTFAIFYQAQAFVALVLSVPILLAVFNRTDGIEAIEWAGAALWVLAARPRVGRGRPAHALQGRPRQQGKDDARRASGASRATRTTSSSG